MRLRKNREAAFGDEIDTVWRYRLFNCLHVVLKPDAKIWVMPSYEGTFKLLQKKRQVFFHDLKIKRLVRDNGIDTETARVRAPQTSDHRNHLYDRRFSKSRLDEFPSLTHSGERRRLLPGGDVHADRTMRRAIVEDLLNDL